MEPKFFSPNFNKFHNNLNQENNNLIMPNT
jgi:hypothetical protein